MILADIETWPQAFAMVGTMLVMLGFVAFIVWCKLKYEGRR